MRQVIWFNSFHGNLRNYFQKRVKQILFFFLYYFVVCTFCMYYDLNSIHIGKAICMSLTKEEKNKVFTLNQTTKNKKSKHNNDRMKKRKFMQ